VTSLAVKVGALTLKNPVLTASGCFGYGLEYDDFYDVAELGGICTKGLQKTFVAPPLTPCFGPSPKPMDVRFWPAF
jgi:dihydroorotate dehydrogenase